ncbi:MAG: magnesium and cobalt transport protein CorA, partial [Armatimonadia bacterium]|nr:magnesium and cobalt transport protein CorA [Armatimonadia bacterium]
MKRRSEKVGAPPGTLVHVGERRAERTQMRVICYDRDHVEDVDVADPSECAVADEGVTWVSVTGLHDVETVRAV